MTQHILKALPPCRRVGAGKLHHFFGYYNKSAWDASDRYLLGNRVPMMDADLTPELVAEVGFFDLQDHDNYHSLGKTTAWNWQMGCQLQWLDGMPGRQFIYNVRTTDTASIYPGFGSCIYNVDTKEER